jgi:sugar (pentulose or hexulose) kinase
MTKHYVAVDLGASSGRTIVGSLADGKLTLREMNRFWNGATGIGETLYWDFLHIFRNIQEGISLARKTFGDGLVSIGIDTWGVDFGLLGPQGQMLENPVNYRDSRTVGMMDEVFSRVPREEVFASTGIQFMEINTLYQLMALSLEDALPYRSAKTLLFSPDLLNYWLTGKQFNERTIASTSQFYNPVTGDWAYDLLEKLGIRNDLFAELVDPGTVIGETDGLPVVAVGSHDTASAFAAVPVEQGESSAFLSSGTWSLLGTEESAPIINAESLAANFTNEAGVCNTVRFLKNLSGLWIIQELRRVWNEQGCDYSFAALADLALEAEPFGFFIDPLDNRFAAPGDMAVRIADFCEETNQARPESHAQILRTTLEGLALVYSDVLDKLEHLTGRSLEALRIIGGGCQHTLLNQLTANATGRKVVTGPIEATAIGNLMIQMLAMGDIGNLAEGRAIVRNTFTNEYNTYLPEDQSAWKVARENWQTICRSA